MKSGENVKVLLVKNDFDDPEILLEMFKSLFKNMKSKEENGYIAICFTYDNNLDYTITRNGNLVGTSKTPYIESNLLENETIGPNSEITYTINYEFKENNQNQNIDQGKLFSTNLELIVK